MPRLSGRVWVDGHNALGGVWVGRILGANGISIFVERAAAKWPFLMYNKLGATRYELAIKNAKTVRLQHVHGNDILLRKII